MTLDKQIHIYAKTDKGMNQYRERIYEDTLKASPFANVNYKGGREGMYARQVTAAGDVTFTIRWMPELDEAVSVKYDGRMYDVKYIEPIGRNQWLALHTQFRANKPLISTT